MLNFADYSSPFITAQSSQTINKIQHTSDALYINVEFNNTIIPITVDTGANICCIKQQLLNQNQIIFPTSIKLLGPKKPLYSLGTTNFFIKIYNHNFEVKAHVINNLSSNIILGNDFLIRNNAIINFNNKIISLNNTVITLLNTVNINTLNNIIQSKTVNICNIQEIEGNIFDSPPDFAIVHCVSSDFRMN